METSVHLNERKIELAMKLAFFSYNYTVRVPKEIRADKHAKIFNTVRSRYSCLIIIYEVWKFRVI